MLSDYPGRKKFLNLTPHHTHNKEGFNIIPINSLEGMFPTDLLSPLLPLFFFTLHQFMSSTEVIHNTLLSLCMNIQTVVYVEVVD